MKKKISLIGAGQIGGTLAYLITIKELGDVPQSLIFVEIKQIYINDNVIDIDEKQRIKVHADKVSPLARLGGGEYAAINKPFSLTRPK